MKTMPFRERRNVRAAFCDISSRHVSFLLVLLVAFSFFLALAAILCGCKFSLLAVISNSDARRVVGRLLQAPTSAAPPSLPWLIRVTGTLFMRNSIREVASHPPTTDCESSEIGHIVVSPAKELYYVLKQNCSNRRVTSIRKANLSRKVPGSNSVDDGSTLLTYLWSSYDQGNGSRIAERPNSTADVIGMAASKDASHLILTVREADSLLSMITSLSILNYSRRSPPLFGRRFFSQLALDLSGDRLVYILGDYFFWHPVDSSGLQTQTGTMISRFGGRPPSVFQSQSLVKDCLYFGEIGTRILFMCQPFNPNSSEPEMLADSEYLRGKSVILTNMNDVVATRDGCHLFLSAGIFVYSAVVRAPCGQFDREFLNEISFERLGGRPRQLALLENEGDSTYLSMGSDDGRLFEVQVNKSHRTCELEAEPSMEAESSMEAEASNAIPPASEGGSLGTRGIAVLATVAVAVVVLVIIATLICLGRRARRLRREGLRLDTSLSGQPTVSLLKGEALETWGIKPSRVKQFSLRILSESTDRFSKGRRIGEKGAFGNVYSGSLDGKEVALKVMSGELTDIKRSQFVAEVNTLSELNHSNLVQLLGFCVEGNYCILVYPFFRGGSLHGRLFPKAGSGSEAKAQETDQVVENPSPPLTLQERMSIAFQVAKGLLYLHDAARPPIIHRDIKSSNILLGDGSGEKLHVVVADFGLATIGERVLATGHDHIVMTSHIGGTFGYMSPEYMLRGELSEKNDVYSYGVLVLEMLTGRKVVGPAPSGLGWQTLVEWAKPFLRGGEEVVAQNAGDAMDMMPFPVLDRSLWDQVAGDSMKKMVSSTLQLAWACVQEECRSRPAMREINQRIHSMFQEVGWDCLTKMMEDLEYVVDDDADAPQNVSGE